MFRTTSIAALSAFTVACGEPQTAFVMQEIVPRVEEGGFNTKINYPIFDAMHLDGMARIDTMDYYVYDIDTAAKDTCKQGLAGRNNLMPPEAWERICDPDWLNCLFTLRKIPDDLHRDAWQGTYHWYSSDILWIDPSLDINEHVCPLMDFANGTPENMQRAVKFQDVLIDNYDNQAFLNNYAQGDVQIVMTNSGDHSRLGTKGNSGICGIWVYSDADYKKLKKTEEDENGDESSELLTDCGASTVLSEVDKVAQVEALTVLRGATKDETNAPIATLDDSFWNEFSSIGDMLGAWALYGADYLTRQKGWCGNFNCPTFSGAMLLTFGDHFRWSLAKDNGKKDISKPGKMHVIMSECELKVKETKGGNLSVAGPRTCWHSELKDSDFQAGNQVVIEVTGNARTK